MIEVSHRDPAVIASWVQDHLRPFLRADVSSYARGRLRCWLGHEPDLSGRRSATPGVPVDDATWATLQAAIGWRFDYCLLTYSGAEATGILPHRDAGYAAYEARGWNLTGTAVFRYWCGRESFGRSPDVRGFGPGDVPTDSVEMIPGTVVRFNCKNLHACAPSADRWAMNFWRAK